MIGHTTERKTAIGEKLGELQTPPRRCENIFTVDYLPNINNDYSKYHACPYTFYSVAYRELAQ
jgi:hypothetical protein